ncbi:MAG: sigma-54-dependent Fis family transcriptional regulator [Gammaproteobacteria bacterium]
MTSENQVFNKPLPETAALLNGIVEPAVLLSPDYRILAANKAYQDAFSGGKSLLNRHCYEASHHYSVPCDQAGETCPLKKCLESGEPHRVLHLHHTSAGEEHVDVSMTPIRDGQGKIIYLLEKNLLIRSASTTPATEGLVGRSPAFNKMLGLIERVAPSNTSVLLLGETGTGKELVARAIHESSQRADGPFVPVECSGLSESLFESELFGHEKGSFTGAHTRKTGLVEAAQQGTLFLDEVGDIPLSQQIKLLRLLETGTYRRVGGVDSLKTDFRLILATHRDLMQQVNDNTFRKDLYYRISAFPIPLPSLRNRGTDIDLLIETLLGRLQTGRSLKLHKDTLNCLRRYDFPGNVRELLNILERASLLADGDTLLPEHLPDYCRCSRHPDQPADPDAIITLEEHERRYLIKTLASFPGDRQLLAEKLGVSKRTLFRKLQSLKLEQ